MGVIVRRATAVVVFVSLAGFVGCSGDDSKRIDSLESEVSELAERLDGTKKGFGQLSIRNSELERDSLALSELVDKLDDRNRQYGDLLETQLASHSETIEALSDRVASFENLVAKTRDTPERPDDSAAAIVGKLSDLEFAEFRRLVSKAKSGELTQEQNVRLKRLGGEAVSKLTTQQDIKRAERRGVKDLLDDVSE